MSYYCCLAYSNTDMSHSACAKPMEVDGWCLTALPHVVVKFFSNDVLTLEDKEELALLAGGDIWHDYHVSSLPFDYLMEDIGHTLQKKYEITDNDDRLPAPAPQPEERKPDLSLLPDTLEEALKCLTVREELPETGVLKVE